MSGEEIKYVQDVFDSNWIAPLGPHLDAFERELATYCGVEHCAALSSGTAAIHLALVILGVGQGDEVLCSTFTFSGSCNPIRYQGATPIFVDSEPESWNIDPQLFEKAIQDRIRHGKRPRAAIIVHLYGMPARIREIMEIARRYDITVIEDAAEALGSSYEGRKLGSFGDIGILSFNGNKIITTSGGGAFLSNNAQWVAEAKHLATQARDAAPHYQHSKIGYNYRLSNVCAAIGRGQLSVIDERVEKRRQIFEYYKSALQGVSAITFQPETPGGFSNRWLTCLQIEPSTSGSVTPEKMRLALEQENIESRPLWKPMHLQPVFEGCLCYGGAVSAGLFENGLCLPSGSAMTNEDQARTVQIVQRLFERKEEDRH
ncbi:MAG TPA: aminotransferase class I/II-fold pyridoxal phosphate-dependent enzyme [Cyclobacteriaceae bacterium]|nr:aminotransferase class I/II-fold pyridoxal phosphate-dependent enzyme [Cyclobacteriaceae bacterium]